VPGNGGLNETKVKSLQSHPRVNPIQAKKEKIGGERSLGEQRKKKKMVPSLMEAFITALCRIVKQNRKEKRALSERKKKGGGERRWSQPSCRSMGNVRIFVGGPNSNETRGPGEEAEGS